MNRSTATLLLVGALLLGAAAGCSRTPPDETKRACARVEHFMSYGSGGVMEYDEEDPARPPIALSLEGAPVLDAALRPVGKLTTLRKLNLASNVRLTDNGLRHLSGLVNLQELNLLDSGISNAGLPHLAGLTSLESLDLGKNPKITDLGLQHLHGLRQLRMLNLAETSVTDAGVEELVKAIPDIQISR